MHPTLTSPKVPIALRPEHIVPSETTFRVTQLGNGLSHGKFEIYTLPSSQPGPSSNQTSSSSSSKDAASSKEAADSSSTSPPPYSASASASASDPRHLFTVDSRLVSRKRHFFDASGLPLFVLRRSTIGMRWQVELPGHEGEGRSIASFNARSSMFKDDIDVSLVNAAAPGGSASSASGGGAESKGKGAGESESEGGNVVLHIKGQDIWKQRTNVLLDDGRVVMTAKRTDKIKVYIPGSKIEWDVTVAAGFDLSLASIIVVLLGDNMYETQAGAGVLPTVKTNS